MPNIKQSGANGLSAQKQADKPAKQLWKPKSAAERSSLTCPYCNNPIDPHFVICPHCGHSLTPDKCSFCGAPMKPGAKFCTKCGQTREGIVCPECGTLNFRNFCRVCNTPLTAMAQRAVTEAKNDPKFKAIQAKAEELAELQAQIEELQKGGGHSAPAELSAADRAMLDDYAAVLASIGVAKPQERKTVESRPQPERPRFEEKVKSLDEIMAAYREKAAEMDAALASLTPPPDFTPEQQRDYYSARKIGRMHTEITIGDGYNPYKWKCNLCGALHSNPTECAQPELGGTWIYISPEDYMAQTGDYNENQTFIIE